MVSFFSYSAVSDTMVYNQSVTLPGLPRLHRLGRMLTLLDGGTVLLASSGIYCGILLWWVNICVTVYAYPHSFMFYLMHHSPVKSSSLPVGSHLVPDDIFTCVNDWFQYHLWALRLSHSLYHWSECSGCLTAFGYDVRSGSGIRTGLWLLTSNDCLSDWFDDVACLFLLRADDRGLC